MLTNLLINAAKILSKFSKICNLGNGSTWPGHIALHIQPQIIQQLLTNAPTKVIFVVGTNGKTTTSRMLATILKQDSFSVLQNTSGANLLNGIASVLLLGTNAKGKLTANYAIFEVDENNLPLVLEYVRPTAIIALNLFRDQLDRYGELDSIAKKWNLTFQKLDESTHLILNADDPLIAYLAKDVKAHVVYYGLSEKEKGQQKVDHAADSIYCPQCGSKLVYKKIFYSHLGIWECPNCLIKRPRPEITESYFPLPGTYNKYNTLAAVLLARILDINSKTIDTALKKVTPAFGRQEKLEIQGKHVQIFLSKNPISMNESLRTIISLGAKNMLLVLNDRIPDGRDISWIWDIGMEEFIDKFKNVIVSGDRCYDMALRISYSMQFPISNFQFPINDQNSKFKIIENLNEAISTALESLDNNETLYILPTYSAMLEVRKILTGKKIL